jgi:hypothetical protein
MSELEDLLAAAQAAATLQIQGKLAGLASVQLALTVPPLPGVTAAAAAKLAVQLAANPSIAAPSLQVAANAKLIGELNAQLAALVMPSLPLGAAGVGAYKVQGTMDSVAGALGNHISNGLPGGSGQDVAYGVLLIATAPAAIAALKELVIG